MRESEQIIFFEVNYISTPEPHTMLARHTLDHSKIVQSIRVKNDSDLNRWLPIMADTIAQMLREEA
jgi:hypothetical protein